MDSENQKYSEVVNNLSQELNELKQKYSDLRDKHGELNSQVAALKADKYWLDKMYQILSESIALAPGRGATILKGVEFALKIVKGYYTVESVDSAFETLKQSMALEGNRALVRKLNSQVTSTLAIDIKKLRSKRQSVNSQQGINGAD